MRVLKLLCLASLFPVALVVFSTACYQSQPQSPSAQGQLKPGKRNQKYNLDYTFHTVEATAGNRIVDGVSIRDNNSGEEVYFEPSDRSSLLLGDGYVKNTSWSPDEEFLILPQGQFEGFCVIKSNEALKSLREKKCFDTIRIQLETGLQMSHQFADWENGSAFVFTAGMERTFPRFRYDFVSRQLSALEKVNDIFEGYNSSGRVPVVR